MEEEITLKPKHVSIKNKYYIIIFRHHEVWELCVSIPLTITKSREKNKLSLEGHCPLTKWKNNFIFATIFSFPKCCKKINNITLGLGLIGVRWWEQRNVFQVRSQQISRSNNWQPLVDSRRRLFSTAFIYIFYIFTS